MDRVASDHILNLAFRWICEQRKKYPPNADIWWLRSQWSRIRSDIQAELLAGCYQLSPVDRIRTRDKAVELWCAKDAVVLKAISIVLSRQLGPEFSASCFHVAGHGGVKKAVANVSDHVGDNKFVFRSDVKSYYASIDHEILIDQLKQHVDDPRILDVLWQYMRRTIYDAGLYKDVRIGIPLGCSLSPLMGALYLKPIDDSMAGTGLFYARFMDDWVVLAPSRWKLRRAVKTINTKLAELKVKQHPDKTFVGSISRGFDFLGFQFWPDGKVGVAGVAVERFVERATRLYEQGADIKRIGKYVRHWAAALGSKLSERSNWQIKSIAFNVLFCFCVAG